MKKIDVVTIGRTSVDLYGVQVGGRLEDMASFHKYIGGSPTNMATGMARLGLKTALITKVGDEQFGNFIIEELAREGVNTQGVYKDPNRLTALAILGIRDQKQFPLLFYRENCADMSLGVENIDPELIRQARAVIVTGTHLSNPVTAAAIEKALTLATQFGLRRVLDIDYRPNLWGLSGHADGENRFIASQKVTSALQARLHHFDLIVGTEEEFHIAGGTTNILEALKAVRHYSNAVLVLKQGAEGASIFEGEIPDSISQAIRGKGFEVEVFNVVGAGDGFMSGLMLGWMQDKDWETALSFANACGAFAVSRHGCTPSYPSLIELEYFLKHGSPHKALRKDKKLEHIHWATNRKGDWSAMHIFAFDHRTQMEEIALKQGIPANQASQKIGEFKQLCLDACVAVAKGRSGYGLLCDERFGQDALFKATDHPLWIARPIEKPASRPLEVEPALGLDFGAKLATWPRNHVVKLLCFYHPDDDQALKCEQEAIIAQAFEAARENGLEFLLEIIHSKSGNQHADTAARVIHRIYELGIYPDWWKLEPFHQEEAWKQAVNAIETHDPYCRGIVILGLESNAQKLNSSFKMAAAYPLVKGFAVGRTIFAEAAELWFAQKLSDTEAVANMTEKFQELCDIWDEARNGAS